MTGMTAIAVAALDQLIKNYVRSVPLGEAFFEIPALFSLEHHTNTGAAFSLLSGHADLLAAGSAVLLIGMMIAAGGRLHLTPAARIALEFLVGGGMGNWIDRLLFSGVTDYIRLSFINFPVFNLADIAITTSIAVLLILLLTDTLEEPAEDKHGSHG